MANSFNQPYPPNAYVFYIDNIPLPVRDGLVAVCAWCHRIRDVTAVWQPINVDHIHQAELQVTHAICEACADKFFSDEDVTS